MNISPDSSRKRLSCVLDGAVICAIVAALVWPLLVETTYLDNWGSIDSVFIGDARFIVENWPHPRWYPLWYGGTRFDYAYPPALRYGTAALSMMLGVPAARAYHLYTAVFYCAGIAALYLFVRLMTGSRLAGWLAALATVSFSPAYFLVDYIQGDANLLFRAPQRLIALVRWGEGPHMSALAVVPLALAAAYWAMKEKSWRAAGLAAIFSALVVSNNFYGGVTLTILFPILAWGLAVTGRDNKILGWAVAIGVLAYSLTAFWLVPSYLRITRANLYIVDAEGEPLHLALAFLFGAAFCAVTYRWGSGRPDRCYWIFVWGALLAFAFIVLGEHWLGVRVTGSPSRFVPELDLVLILFALQLARWMWTQARAWFSKHTWLPRAGFGLVGALVLMGSFRYLSNAWRIYPEAADYQQRVEYRLSGWMARNLPGVRAHVDGSVRFWYNAWHSLAYLAGGANQGMLNQAILPALQELRFGENGEISIRWLQSFGVDAIIVHDQNSEEIYHDYRHPYKFEGLLPLLFDNGQGDVIYRVPRRYPGLARVVYKSGVDQLPPIGAGWDLENVAAYAKLVEEGPQSPADFAWEATDAMQVTADVKEGEMLLLQVAYDRAWHAYRGDEELVVRKDVLGQMLVDVPPGSQRVRFVFELPLENIIGRVVSLVGGLVIAFLLFAPRHAGRSAQR